MSTTVTVTTASIRAALPFTERDTVPAGLTTEVELVYRRAQDGRPVVNFNGRGLVAWEAITGTPAPAKREALELVIEAARRPGSDGRKSTPGPLSMSLAEVRDLEEQELMTGYSVPNADGSHGYRWTLEGAQAVWEARDELERTDDLADVEERVTRYLETREAHRAIRGGGLR